MLEIPVIDYTLSLEDMFESSHPWTGFKILQVMCSFVTFRIQ